MQKLSLKEILHLLLIALAGLGLRLAYLISLLPVCRADEAVFGLMTKHLLEGKELPIYLYGAHYAGALICYLAAIPFLLFGISMPVLKLTTYLFTLPTIVLIYFLSREMFGRRAAVLSTLFFAVPPFLITWVGQYAGGGYPETLFFGACTLFLAHRLLSKENSPREELRVMALLGFLNGIGTWILFSMIPYTLTLWTLIPFKKTRTPLMKLLVVFLIFYSIGILPMVIYNVQHPLATFMRLGANVMTLERSDISGKGGNELLGLGLLKVGLKLFGLPKAVFQVMRNIWAMMRLEPSLGGVATIWDPLLAGAIGFSFFTAAKSARRNFTRNPLSLPLTLVGWMVLFLAVTGLTKTRYVSFMVPALAVLFAFSIFQCASKRWIAISLGAVFLSANLVNHLIALKTPESEDRFGELVDFLSQRGLTHGYTDYVKAYPIVFLTREGIIASPLAGPLNVERVPSYTREVDQAKEVFFAFDRDSEASGRFEGALKLRQVSFKREDVLNHSVYHTFSKRIYPRELPLIRFFPSD